MEAITEIILFKYLHTGKMRPLLGELWQNVGRTQELLLYSSLNDNIAHIAILQLQCS